MSIISIGVGIVAYTGDSEIGGVDPPETVYVLNVINDREPDPLKPRPRVRGEVLDIALDSSVSERGEYDIHPSELELYTHQHLFCD